MFKFIPQQHTAIIQSFGKFSRLGKPGLCFYLAPFQSLNLVSNKLAEREFSIQVRTVDKVFPELHIALQCKIYP